MQLRIGNGFDVHRFDVTPDVAASVRLGGVDIPHTHRLEAHSDGDVLLHALCDALLGALALGDIGRHFPDSDERYRGISSVVLLEEVYGLVSDKGWHLVNADMTIIAQAPRVAAHVADMQARITECLGIDDGLVSIKATTTEHLGFTGREEGIACAAVVLLGKAA